MTGVMYVSRDSDRTKGPPAAADSRSRHADRRLCLCHQRCPIDPRDLAGGLLMTGRAVPAEEIPRTLTRGADIPYNV
jgi:hypothetical protein